MIVYRTGTTPSRPVDIPPEIARRWMKKAALDTNQHIYKEAMNTPSVDAASMGAMYGQSVTMWLIDNVENPELRCDMLDQFILGMEKYLEVLYHGVPEEES